MKCPIVVPLAWSLLALSWLSPTAAKGAEASEAFGRFSGEPETQWGPGGRYMTLTKDFWYRDQHGVRWNAPKDSRIDGSSIPRVVWTLVGSPYVGKHRYASIVHDVACEKPTRPWQEVHWMYYNACRRGGVEEPLATMMFWAVYYCGPRWPRPDDTKWGGFRWKDGFKDFADVGRDAPPRAKAVGSDSMLSIGTDDGTKTEFEYRVLTDEQRARLEKKIREDGSPEEKEFLRLKEKIEREKLSLKAMMEF